MDDIPARGNLSEIALAELLFLIWKKERSGLLKLRQGKEEIRLCFDKGDLAIERHSFPETEFLRDLFESDHLELKDLEDCETYARENRLSCLRALIELGIFTPSRLWQLVEDYWRQAGLAVFDWESGEFTLEPVRIPKEAQLVRGILTPSFILQGLRASDRDAFIQSQLPPESQLLQPLAPHYLERLELEPPERYLLGLIDGSRTVRQILEGSELGRQACGRLLYAFVILGIAGSFQPGNRVKPNSEPLHLELNRIFEAFNEKCSYIYKYMSKELGPLALNILEKCLDEIRLRLDPIFQTCELSPEGKIILNQGKAVLQLASEEGRSSFLRALDEILTAEVLAVKRTLGPNHESAVVRNLERVGDLG